MPEKVHTIKHMDKVAPQRQVAQPMTQTWFAAGQLADLGIVQRVISDLHMARPSNLATLQRQIGNRVVTHSIQCENTKGKSQLGTAKLRKIIVDTALGLTAEHYLMGAAGHIPDQGGGLNSRDVKINAENHTASIDVFYGEETGIKTHVCAGRYSKVTALPEADPKNKDHHTNATNYRWKRISGRNTVSGEACEGKRHFDCGGFVSYCYHQACPEIKHPGPASELLTSRFGWTEIGREQVQAGDVAYRDGHVGLCLNKDKVVSALGKKWGVDQESSSKYTKFGYLGCLKEPTKAQSEGTVQKASNPVGVSSFHPEIVQLSPFSDHLMQLWLGGRKTAFFDRLRNLSVSDRDVHDLITERLTGDDQWLALNLMNYGPESNWPAALQEEKQRREKERNSRSAQLTPLLARLTELSDVAKKEGTDGAEFSKAVAAFKATLGARMDAVAWDQPLPPDMQLIMKALMLWSHDPGNQWGEGIWDSRDLLMSASEYALVPASQYKCTAYVAESIYQALGVVHKAYKSKQEKGKYFPYQAAEWGDPKLKIPHFSVVTKPQMGDIWSTGPHVGIYLGTYSGKGLYVSARDGGKGVFALDRVQKEYGIQIKYVQSGGTYRRYTP